MLDLKPNSFKYREEQQKLKEKEQEQEKVQKVVNGSVTTVKKSGFRKIANSIISDDIPKVRDFIRNDVVIPSLKKAITDIVKNGIDIFMYGDSGRGKNSGRTNSRVSYRDYYDSPRTSSDRLRAGTAKAAYDFEDPLFETRGDAELVLDQMEDIIEKYGFVKISDLYDLSGITTSNYCFNNYGWVDLHTATVNRVSDGYIIKLPRAFPLN